MLRRALALLAVLLLALPHVPGAAAEGHGLHVRAVSSNGEAVAPGQAFQFVEEVTWTGADPIEVWHHANASDPRFVASTSPASPLWLQPNEPQRVETLVHVPADAEDGFYAVTSEFGLVGAAEGPSARSGVTFAVSSHPRWTVQINGSSVVAPGEVARFEARVESREPTSVVLDVSATDPAGILFPTVAPSRVEVASGGVATIRIEVPVPSDAPAGSYEIRLLTQRVDRPASSTTQGAFLYVMAPPVEPSPPPDHPTPENDTRPYPTGPTTPTAWGTPEGNFTFEARALDELVAPRAGRASVAFSFTTSGGPAPVAYRVREEDGRIPLGASASGTIYVPPDETTQRTLEVDVARASPGDYRLVFEFWREQDPTVLASVEVALRVPDPLRASAPARASEGFATPPRLEIVLLDDPGAPVTAGGEGEGRVQVRLVDSPDPVVVTLRGGVVPGGWNVTWPEPFALAPGETRVMRVTLAAPADAVVGSQASFPFRATTGGAAAAVDARAVAVVIAPPHGDSFSTLASLARDHPLASGGAVVAVGAALVAIPLWRREWWRYLAAIPLLPLYTRLKKSEVLDHGTRERIHQMIVREPGIHYSALKDATGLHVGALVHHLRTLERHGLVASRREGVLRRFYPTGQRLPPAPAVPLTPTQARIVQILEAQPLTQRELAARLGVTQQGVSYHLKTLERKGIVATRRDGAETRYAPAASPPSAPEAQAPSRGLA